MAISSQPKGKVDGTLKLIDGTGTAVELTVLYTSGDLNIGGLVEGLREVTAVETRGTFIGLVKTERKYIEGSIGFVITQFTAASAPGTLQDFVLQRGAYSANVSTLGAGRPYTFNVEATWEGTDYGDSADHAGTLVHCRGTIDITEGEVIMGTLNYTSYGPPTGDFSLSEG